MWGRWLGWRAGSSHLHWFTWEITLWTTGSWDKLRQEEEKEKEAVCQSGVGWWGINLWSFKVALPRTGKRGVVNWILFCISHGHCISNSSPAYRPPLGMSHRGCLHRATGGGRYLGWAGVRGWEPPSRTYTKESRVSGPRMPLMDSVMCCLVQQDLSRVWGAHQFLQLLKQCSQQEGESGQGLVRSQPCSSFYLLESHWQNQKVTGASKVNQLLSRCWGECLSLKLCKKRLRGWVVCEGCPHKET